MSNCLMNSKVTSATQALATPFCGNVRRLAASSPLKGSRMTSRSPVVAPSALFTRNKTQQGKRTGYDQSAYQQDNILQPVFSRRREVFAGRLAMLGFASALIGEITTGRGALGQLQLELGLPSIAVDAIVFGTIGWSLFGALRPGSPTFSEANQRDVKKRGSGPLQNPKKNLVNDPKGTLGTGNEFGFNKANELIVGRTAQLGFLAAIIGEKITGYGPLKQLNIETGIPIGQASFGLLVFIGFFLVAPLFTGQYGDAGIDDDKSY